jgi:aldose 1-epimerase
MADEQAVDVASRLLASGPLTRIGCGSIEVTIAPQAGGRVAEISCDGVDWLRSHDSGDPAAIAWGCYPMVPAGMGVKSIYSASP